MSLFFRSVQQYFGTLSKVSHRAEHKDSCIFSSDYSHQVPTVWGAGCLLSAWDLFSHHYLWIYCSKGTCSFWIPYLYNFIFIHWQTKLLSLTFLSHYTIFSSLLDLVAGSSVLEMNVTAASSIAPSRKKASHTTYCMAITGLSLSRDTKAYRVLINLPHGNICQL